MSQVLILGRGESLKRLKEIITIKDKFEYVGDKFPEEARAIHYGEKKERKIYGEASLDEAKNLHDEGISLSAIPELASPKNKKKLN